MDGVCLVFFPSTLFFGASLFFIPEGFASKTDQNPALQVIFFRNNQGKHADFLQCLPSFLPRVSGISMDSTFPSSEAFSVDSKPQESGQWSWGSLHPVHHVHHHHGCGTLPSERVDFPDGMEAMYIYIYIYFFSCKIRWQVFSILL